MNKHSVWFVTVFIPYLQTYNIAKTHIKSIKQIYHAFWNTTFVILLFFFILIFQKAHKIAKYTYHREAYITLL